jgi:hypothetical protein
VFSLIAGLFNKVAARILTHKLHAPPQLRNSLLIPQSLTYYKSMYGMYTVSLIKIPNAKEIELCALLFRCPQPHFEALNASTRLKVQNYLTLADIFSIIFF